MYVNVLSFKNGKTLAFQSKVPFSVDKLEDNEFLVITDESNGQILSFRTSEVVTIATIKAPTGRKTKGFKATVTKVTEE